MGGGNDELLDVYILEDNLAELSQINHYVRSVSEKLNIQANVRTFSTLEQINQSMPEPSLRNVYILDLAIGDDDQAGLKFSQKIRQYDLEASIIFLTVHDELLSTTYQYQVEALDFIVKDPKRVVQSLERDFTKVIKKLELPKRCKTITLRSHYEIIKVYVNDILFFQSNPDNTHASFMYTENNQKIPINMSLRELEEQAEEFFRIHRRYLANVANIRSLNVKQHTVKFNTSEMTVPVSRLKTRKLMEVLNNYSSIQW